MMKPKKKKPAFAPEAFLAKVQGGHTVSNYRKNAVVYAQGELADSVFYIHKGKAKITVLSKQGKEAVVALLGPGDFFGEGCLAAQPRRMATASVMTDCLIARMIKADIVRVIREEPAFSELFIAHW